MVGASTLLSVPAAEAASWGAQNSSGVRYETCTSAQLQERRVRDLHPTLVGLQQGARRDPGFGVGEALCQGQPLSAGHRRSHNISAPSCSGTLARGAKKQCATSWLSATRIVQFGEGTVWIAGSRRPGMRVRGMHFWGKKQENAEKYCGPASVQAAIHTMKGSAPSQGTLAGKLKTNTYGFTPPNKLAPALNAYKPSAIAKYHLYDFGSTGQSTEYAFRQLWRSIESGNPVVYLVDPSKLPWSSASGTRVRHYIELHGYTAMRDTVDSNVTGGWKVDRFQAFDPASGSVRNITPIQLLNASVASDYIDDDLVFAAK
jgi:peptidase C39-like protein